MKLLLAFVLATLPLFGAAYGHGLGGDMAPPISFAGMNVTVSTQLTPADVTVGEVDAAMMSVRFYDVDKDINLDKVTYRIDVYRSNDLLARNLFYSDDGQLDVEIKPVHNCAEAQLWRCTDYFGSEHALSPGALYTYGSQPIEIHGPIFDKGGLYNIKVVIEGATGPRTLVAQDLPFDTFVSVAQEQDFVIQAASAEVPVTIKTYYDDITSLDYSMDDKVLTFEMPFDWDPEYVSLVQMVHQEIRYPKSFAPYSIGDQFAGDAKSFKGYVNGVEVNSRILLLDPYTGENEGYDVVHFQVSTPELERINEVLGVDNYDSGKMVFELVPQGVVERNAQSFYLVDVKTDDRVGATVNVAWDGDVHAGDDVPFEFSFLDEDGDLLKDVSYVYWVYDEEGTLVTLGGNATGLQGLAAPEGIDTRIINIPTTEQYRIDVAILGQATLGEGSPLDSTYMGIGSTIFEVGQAGNAESVSIPSWLKKNADMWASNQIDDATFVSAIQWLMQKGIIQVEYSEAGSSSATSIPSWLKNNAAMWASSQIDDATFAGALQWLIQNGIVVV